MNPSKKKSGIHIVSISIKGKMRKNHRKSIIDMKVNKTFYSAKEMTRSIFEWEEVHSLDCPK